MLDSLFELNGHHQFLLSLKQLLSSLFNRNPSFLSNLILSKHNQSHPSFFWISEGILYSTFKYDRSPPRAMQKEHKKFRNWISHFTFGNVEANPDTVIQKVRVRPPNCFVAQQQYPNQQSRLPRPANKHFLSNALAAPSTSA